MRTYHGCVQLFDTPSKSHTSYAGLEHLWDVVKSIDDDLMCGDELATYMRESVCVEERHRVRGCLPRDTKLQNHKRHRQTKRIDRPHRLAGCTLRSIHSVSWTKSVPPLLGWMLVVPSVHRIVCVIVLEGLLREGIRLVQDCSSGVIDCAWLLKKSVEGHGSVAGSVVRVSYQFVVISMRSAECTDD